jgi:hypothetical protein
MSLILDLPPDLEAELRKAAALQGKDVRQLVQDSIRQQLRRDILPEAESALLQVINEPLAPEVRERRDALLSVQDQRQLTDAERVELTDTIDAVEIANARRWHALAELADRRRLSLADIASELQIPLPA